ncbi:MAG TPA: polysaccharide biosynthesis C-terminal domain-containing protein [Blastocatellia bacterium]|nr:polysaccharide biosynthesis C-terminal domain-containing protein [Blastocatellia bacterium]
MTFTKSVALRALAEIVAKASSVVLMVAAARILQPREFGEFSLAWAAGWLAATGTDLGLHLVTARELARGRAGAVHWAKRAFEAKLGLTAAMVAVGVAAALFGGILQPTAFLAVGGAVVALSYVDFAQHVLRARGAFGRDAAVLLVARGAMVGLGLWGLISADPTMFSLLLFTGAIAGACIALLVARRDVRGLDAAGGATVGRADVLASALPVGLGIALSIVCFRLDLFLLEAIKGASFVGVYAAAYRIFEAAQLIPAVGLTVLFPRLAASGGATPEGRTLRRRSFAALVAAGVAVSVVGMVVSSVLVNMLFGREYGDAVLPLRVLLLAAPFMFGNYLLTQDLVSAGRQRAYAALAAGALGVNLAGNLWAIPRFGMAGAAAVTVATEIALMVGCLVVSGRLTKRTPDPLDEAPA